MIKWKFGSFWVERKDKILSSSIWMYGIISSVLTFTWEEVCGNCWLASTKFRHSCSDTEVWSQFTWTWKTISLLLIKIKIFMILGHLCLDDLKTIYAMIFLAFSFLVEQKEYIYNAYALFASWFFSMPNAVMDFVRCQYYLFYINAYY